MDLVYRLCSHVTWNILYLIGQSEKAEDYLFNSRVTKKVK